MSVPSPTGGPLGDHSRHISIRLPTELYQRLEALAANGNETVSQAARRLLSEGLEPADQDAIDQTISTLLLVRDQLLQRRASTPAPSHPAPSDPAPSDPVPSDQPRVVRTVDLFSARTNLQHLIDDVARGAEIVITYAGTRRARLVPVGHPEQ